MAEMGRWFYSGKPETSVLTLFAAVGDWYKNKRPVSVHSTTPVFYPFIHQSSFYFTSMPLFFKVIFSIVVYFVY